MMTKPSKKHLPWWLPTVFVGLVAICVLGTLMVNMFVSIQKGYDTKQQRIKLETDTKQQLSELANKLETEPYEAVKSPLSNVDVWGNALLIEYEKGGVPVVGRKYYMTIRSLGPDGEISGDDMTIKRQVSK